MTQSEITVIASTQVIDVDAEPPAPMTPPAPTAPKSYVEAGIQVVEPKKSYAETAIQAQEMVSIPAGDSSMAPAMPVAVNAVSTSSLPFALPSSVAPAPTSSPIPSVNLLPPTPNMSQEATTSGAMAHLEVPVPSLITGALRSRSPTRSRSPSPASPVEIRRSPRLTSLAPLSKRPASDPLDDNRASKRSKEQ